MFKRTEKGDTTTIIACLPLGVKVVFISGKYGKRISLQKWREVGDNFAILKTLNLEEVSQDLFKVSKSVNILEKRHTHLLMFVSFLCCSERECSVFQYGVVLSLEGMLLNV